jgi:type III secretion protein D
MFDVGGIAVSVRRLEEGAAALNGEAFGDTRRSVVPGDVITLGAIRIGIERAGTIRMPTVAAEGVRAQATAAEHLPSWLPAAAARWVARWSGKAGRGRTWLFAGIALWLAVSPLRGLMGGRVGRSGAEIRPHGRSRCATRWATPRRLPWHPPPTARCV